VGAHNRVFHSLREYTYSGILGLSVPYHGRGLAAINQYERGLLSRGRAGGVDCELDGGEFNCPVALIWGYTLPQHLSDSAVSALSNTVGLRVEGR